MIKNLFLKNIKTNNLPSTAELIERGFEPKNGRIDILFIYPSDDTAKRYGKKDRKFRLRSF